MKKLKLIILGLILTNFAFGQVNDTGGNVGIGITPSYKLDVAGDLHIDQNTLLFATPNYINGDHGRIQFIESGDPDQWNFSYYQNSVLRSQMRFSSTSEAAGDGFVSFPVGKVGIGTENPTSLLDIAKPNALNGESLIFNLTLKGAKSSIRSTLRHSTNNVSDLSFFTDPDGGSALERMRITENGNVGIGTTSPSSLLEIANLSATHGGNVAFNFTLKDAKSSIRSTLMHATNNVSNLSFFTDPDGGSALERMRITENGNVGIGTTSTGSHRLAVEGSIGAREIKVEATGWSDFVFKRDYELRTLEEVEKHIAENGHLPEIPSEAEVSENGINLGEMDTKLLQKIEELTLYLIEQNKQNKKQEQRIEKLEKLNSELLEKLENE